MNSQHRKQPQKPQSNWVRAWRDLGSPQGSVLLGVFLLCAVISMVFDAIGKRLNLPSNLVYAIIIIINLAGLAFVGFKLSAMYKEAEKWRKERYRQKFGDNDKNEK